MIGTVSILLCLASPGVSQTLPNASPEDVGLSAERLQRINRAMQEWVDQEKLPGFLTMIARRGKVVHIEKVGMMDVEASKPVEFDTIFRIYSMSKPITSVAVMMLYEEGHFQLNDPVSKYIPEFKDLKVYKGKTESGFEVVDAEREMTVRDLLRHTSGLSYGWSGSPVDELYQKANIFAPDSNLTEMIRKLGLIPLLHQPGTVWEYSVSTDVLGYLVEVISGMRFDEFLEERMFQPLGMVDTGFHVPEEKMGRLATLYSPVSEDDDTLKRVDVGPLEHQLGDFFHSGGGGLLSTASDYMRFCQMLLNGGELDGVRLLSPKTIDLMTRDHLSDDHPFDAPGVGFGLGFAVITDLAQYGGLGSEGNYAWGGAASTVFWIDPKEELVGLLMTQLLSNPHPTESQFKTLVYQAVID